jgi:hypothetical protein
MFFSFEVRLAVDITYLGTYSDCKAMVMPF